MTINNDKERSRVVVDLEIKLKEQKEALQVIIIVGMVVRYNFMVMIRNGTRLWLTSEES